MFGDVAGTLTPGNRADVVLLDTKWLYEPGTHPDLSATELVMARGRTVDVRTVLIDGRVVYEDGMHAWIDREELVAELRAIIDEQMADPVRQQAERLALDLAAARDDYMKREI
jgi:cytosine/adenosine deaminase-related metal-dependent hydrolase